MEENLLIEVFRFMMRHRVRRLVIQRRKRFYCCTEREIMRALFSPDGFQLLRDDPNALLEMPIEHFVSPFLSPVTNLSGDHDVAEGWVHAANSPSCTVIVDEERIASPWDLVIRPFLAGKLPF
ncbi:MAG: hypothetical protein LYZ69_04255 [Nitrososphaerales archaeon]|nr:hypothetical protein [Nitrososphaerales archaeon]